jgi:hypothetical protein
MFTSVLFTFTTILFAITQVSSATSPVEVRTEDSALLPIPGAVLYNNVYQPVSKGKKHLALKMFCP